MNRPIESIIKTIGAIVLIPLIWYGFFAFIYLSIDPAIWPKQARVVFMIATLASWAILFLIHNEKKQ